MERRRVLDAAVQSLVVTVVTSSDAATTTSTATQQAATTQPPLDFNWAPLPGASGPGSESPELVQGIGQNAAPVLVVPLDQNVDEGQLLDLSGMAGAPPVGLFIDTNLADTHAATIDWGDGTAESATIFQGVGAGALGGSHTYADQGTYTVTVAVMDNQGGSDSDTFHVIVGQIAPTATFANDGPVDEGTPATVSFSSPFDPSSADTLAGFHYAYDLNNDGTFDVGDGTYGGSVASASQNVPTSILGDGPSDRTVKGRIIDKDGQFTDYTTTIQVQNVAPILVNISGDTINENDAATISMTIVDPSTSDFFQVQAGWLDGSSTSIGGLGAVDVAGTIGSTSYQWTAATRQLTLSHKYLDDGPTTAMSDTYQVTLVVLDDDLGTSGPYTASVVVNDVPPVLVAASPQNLFEGDLLDLSGTNGAPFLGTFSDVGTLDTHTATVDWGDGAAVASATVFQGAGAGKLGGTHVYADDGVYRVTITVTDKDGKSDTEEFTVTVGNRAPIVQVPHGDQSILEGQTIGFADLATFADAGFDNVLNPNAADPPQIVDPLHESFTYDIDWGDGRDAVVGMGIADLDGGPGVPSSGTIGGSHTYADDGNYTVTITVHDDNGGVGVATFVVHVDNVEPTLTGTSNLVVNEGQFVTLDGLGVGITDPGFDNPLNTLDPLNGGELAETLSAMSITWGDGTATEPLALAEFQAVPFQGPTTATFPGASHTYADNGTYTVSVTIMDDDMTGFVTRTFTITVENVAPQLAGLTSSPLAIDENGSVSFNVQYSDAGFDNPLNTLDPANGGEVAESFTYDINWGDGRQEVVSAFAPDVNGAPGVFSSGSFGGSHTYADDGTYTVTIAIHDDDGGSATQTFQVVASNVAPIIQPDGAIPPFQGTDVTHQGFTHIQLMYSDIGFDNTANPNPAEPPTVTDRLHESFTHIIDWGDGSVDAVHTYAQPGTYTVLVTPPGAVTPLQFIVTVSDISQPPVLTLVGSQASLNDGGVVPQAYQYVVNWGDDPSGDNDTVQTITLLLKNPVGDPFLSTLTTVLQAARLSGNEGIATTGSFDIQHRYLGPPNPLHPTQDIPISVTVMDDNLGIDTASIAIGNPGIQEIFVAIDTTPDVPKLEYVPPASAFVFIDRQSSALANVQNANSRVVIAEMSATSDRYLELVVISPEGEELQRYRLRDEALADLRGLIATLPDGHYKIYLIRTDNNSRRLVLDVYVRRGRVIDPSDSSEGTRDRPPEGAQQIEAQPLEDNRQLERVPEEKATGAMTLPATPAVPVALQERGQPPGVVEVRQEAAATPNSTRLRWAAPLAGLGLVAARRRGWAGEVEAAFGAADERTWRRLRQAGRKRLPR